MFHPQWHADDFDIYVSSQSAHFPAQSRELYWAVLMYLSNGAMNVKADYTYIVQLPSLSQSFFRNI